MDLLCRNVLIQEAQDLGKRQSQFLECQDAVQMGELERTVKAIARLRIDAFRFE